MTWLFGGGQAAATTAQTGNQLATQTATAAPTAVSTGAIGQTGITGGMSTPAYSAFPQASADLAKFTAHPLDTTYAYLQDNLKQRMGMSSGTGADPGGMNPPAATGAGGMLHGMLSARKTQAPSSGTGEPPPTQSRPRRQYQSADGQQSINDILAALFGGQ